MASGERRERKKRERGGDRSIIELTRGEREIGRT